MTLVGDVGGFNGAAIIFPLYFLSFFSEMMFKKAVAEDMPVKVKSSKTKKNNALQDRLTSDEPNSNIFLDHNHIKSLANEASKISK